MTNRVSATASAVRGYRTVRFFVANRDLRSFLAAQGEPDDDVGVGAVRGGASGALSTRNDFGVALACGLGDR